MVTTAVAVDADSPFAKNMAVARDAAAAAVDDAVAAAAAAAAVAAAAVAAAAVAAAAVAAAAAIVTILFVLIPAWLSTVYTRGTDYGKNAHQPCGRTFGQTAADL